MPERSVLICSALVLPGKPLLGVGMTLSTSGCPRSGPSAQRLLVEYAIGP